MPVVCRQCLPHGTASAPRPRGPCEVCGVVALLHQVTLPDLIAATVEAERRRSAAICQAFALSADDIEAPAESPNAWFRAVVVATSESISQEIWEQSKKG